MLIVAGFFFFLADSCIEQRQTNELVDCQMQITTKERVQR